MEVIFTYLAKLAGLDGGIAPEQEKNLRKIANFWGIGEGFYRNCISKSNSRLSIYNCYQVLGCDPEASWEVIKKTYRELALKYHPDCYSGKNLPKTKVEELCKHFVEIQKAYKQVKDARGIV